MDTIFLTVFFSCIIWQTPALRRRVSINSLPIVVTFGYYSSVRLSQDLTWFSTTVRGLITRSIEGVSTRLPLVKDWLRKKMISCLKAQLAYASQVTLGLWDTLCELADGGSKYFEETFGDWSTTAYTIAAAVLPFLLCYILLDMIVDRYDPYEVPCKPARLFRGFTRPINPLFIWFGPLSTWGEDECLAKGPGFTKGVCKQTQQASEAGTADTFTNKDGVKCVWLPWGKTRLAIPVEDVLTHFGVSQSRGLPALRGVKTESAVTGSIPYLEMSKAPDWSGFISRAHGGDPTQGTDQLSGVTRVRQGFDLSLHSMEAFQQHIEQGGSLYYRRASLDINEPWLEIDSLAKKMPGLIPLTSYSAFDANDPRRENYLCGRLHKSLKGFSIPVSGADHCTLFPACTGFERRGNKCIPLMDLKLNEQCFSRLGLRGSKYISNAKRGRCRIWSMMPKSDSNEVALHKAEGMFDCGTPTPFDEDLNVAMKNVQRKSTKPIYTGLGTHSASTGCPTSREDGEGSSSSSLTLINKNGTDGDIVGKHIASIGRGAADYERFASRGNKTNFMASSYVYYRTLEAITDLKFTRRVQIQPISSILASAPGMFARWTGVKTETPTVEDNNFPDSDYDPDEVDLRGVYLSQAQIARYDDGGHDFSRTQDQEDHDQAVQNEQDWMHQEVAVYGGGEADAGDHRRINRMRGLSQRMHAANRKGGPKRAKRASPEPKSPALTKDELNELLAHCKDVLENDRLLVSNAHTFNQLQSDILLLTELINQVDYQDAASEATESTEMVSCADPDDYVSNPPLPIAQLAAQSNTPVSLPGVKTESPVDLPPPPALEREGARMTTEEIREKTNPATAKFVDQIHELLRVNPTLTAQRLCDLVNAWDDLAEQADNKVPGFAEVLKSKLEQSGFQEAGSKEAGPNAQPADEEKKKRTRRKKKPKEEPSAPPSSPPGLE